MQGLTGLMENTEFRKLTEQMVDAYEGAMEPGDGGEGGEPVAMPEARGPGLPDANEEKGDRTGLDQSRDGLVLLERPPEVAHYTSLQAFLNAQSRPHRGEVPHRSAHASHVVQVHERLFVEQPAQRSASTPGRLTRCWQLVKQCWGNCWN